MEVCDTNYVGDFHDFCFPTKWRTKSATFILCVRDFPRGKVLVNVGVIWDLGLISGGTA